MDKIAETKRAIRLREWSEMYRVYQSSGKTVSAWCTEQELSVKTFYYRLRKIRESALETTEKHEIVPLSPSPAAVPICKAPLASKSAETELLWSFPKTYRQKP